jgi:sporulation protein YlmC with PRC-barrel domain
MKRKKRLTLLVLVATAIASPAAANWFSNPLNNTQLNIGSAPSPTPEDLRLIGDSAYYPDLTFRLDSIVGKPVYTRNMEYIGPVRSVNQITRVALVQLPKGVAVPVSANEVRDAGDRVILPRLAQRDIDNRARVRGVITGPSTAK